MQPPQYAGFCEADDCLYCNKNGLYYAHDIDCPYSVEKLCETISTIEAENARLREALKTIEGIAGNSRGDKDSRLNNIALYAFSALGGAK